MDQFPELRVEVPTLEPDAALLAQLVELSRPSRVTDRGTHLKVLLAAASVAAIAVVSWLTGSTTGINFPSDDSPLMPGSVTQPFPAPAPADPTQTPTASGEGAPDLGTGPGAGPSSASVAIGGALDGHHTSTKTHHPSGGTSTSESPSGDPSTDPSGSATDQPTDQPSSGVGVGPKGSDTPAPCDDASPSGPGLVIPVSGGPSPSPSTSGSPACGSDSPTTQPSTLPTTGASQGPSPQSTSGSPAP